MAGRPSPTAGRRLPIRRAVAALAALSAAGTGQAIAAGEWTVQPGTPDPVPGENVWQVAPAGGTWSVGPATAAAAASPTPEGILDVFVAKSVGGPAAPPAPPTAVVPEYAPAPVQLDPDTPEVVALAAAEDVLAEISAELADVRSQIETAGEADLAELRARETRLTERKAEAATKVDELQAVVERLLEKAREEAAATAAAQPSPFFGSALAFSPVSGTVPVVDADLASRLDAYLGSKGSPFTGLGAVFVYQSTAVGLDPRLLVAISGAETSFGTYGPSQRIHNPFGMGPGIVYPSWEASIAGAARNLGGSLYKGAGLVTIAQIQRRWAPLGAGNDPTNLNSHWYRNVSRYYTELGGDPNGTVFTDRAASQLAIPVAPGVAPGIQGTLAAPTAYGPAATVPGGGEGDGPAAVQLAVRYVGVSYRAGGTSPSSGFDAPGLVRFAYAKQGVTLPATSDGQARIGTPLGPEQLAPGDAVFFADGTGRIRHEGLYVGKGYFVHAPQPGEVVKISSLYEPYYATQYAGARRY
jgi:cell wall-associated NlpC family hydrolase